jgi:hypothetical protein
MTFLHQYSNQVSGSCGYRNVNYMQGQDMSNNEMNLLVSSVSESEGNVDSQNEELSYKLKVTLPQPQR